MHINIIQLDCKRCGWEWTPRRRIVRVCPHCNSPYWDVPREDERMMKEHLEAIKQEAKKGNSQQGETHQLPPAPPNIAA